MTVSDGTKLERLECKGNVFDYFTAGALQIRIALNPGEKQTIRFTVGVETSVKPQPMLPKRY